MNMIHIFPLADLKDHTIEGTGCECGPSVDWHSCPEPVATHHPFDGRRQLEIRLSEAHIDLKVQPEKQSECGVWEIKKEKEVTFEEEQDQDLFV